jgi:hypothetical protein
MTSASASQPHRPSTPPRLSVISAADLLSYIPHSLGFMPEESLVFLTMNGKRLGATLRVDLPAIGDDGGQAADAAYAAAICSYLRSDRAADCVLMIMYTARPWKVPHNPPRRPLVEAIRTALGRSGLEIRDGWLVSAQHWRDYFCADAACCPWPGHSLNDISDSRLSAELVFSGSSYAQSPQSTPELASRPWDSRPEVAQALERCRTKVNGRWKQPAQFKAALAVWDAVLVEGQRRCGPAAANEPGDEEPSLGAAAEAGAPELAAFLLASLTSRTVRDAVLVLAAHGLPAALAGAVAHGLLEADEDGASAVYPEKWNSSGAPAFPELPTAGAEPGAPSLFPDTRLEPASETGTVFRDILSGQYPDPLDWGRVDAAGRLLAGLCGAADGPVVAPVLTMLGWIEWARGRGSRAHVRLAEALRADPGYTLAALLSELVETGVLPAWARVRESAWKEHARRAA